MSIRHRLSRLERLPQCQPRDSFTLEEMVAALQEVERENPDLPHEECVDRAMAILEQRR